MLFSVYYNSDSKNVLTSVKIPVKAANKLLRSIATFANTRRRKLTTVDSIPAMERLNIAGTAAVPKK